MSERNAVKTSESQPGSSVRLESQAEYFGMTEESKPFERSPFRTVLPPTTPIVSGADSLRAVTENVEHNITETRAAIEKNMAEAIRLEHRLNYLLKLQTVAEDYKNGK